MLLQQIITNVDTNNNYFANTNNIPFSPFSPFIQNDINTNSINIQKNQTNLLNKKTSRENSKESINKKNKIFGIIKIKNREKEDAKEQKRKQYLYRGSKYRGVSRNGKTWQVLIMVNRNKKYIGKFKSEDEAAKAYDEYAMKYHKNKARLNFEHQGFIKYVNKP